MTAQPVEDGYEVPEAECPRCLAVQHDLDGFGVQWCGVCGYCRHPMQTQVKATGKFVCDLCQKVMEDETD